ncbi:MAG: calcium-translocating P-type ATPase, PMCA-type [Planctomycetota bacterium]|jgi:Ca2+-transporting ATPase|nr:calcium-translocating P-type ATPase, PMCA-type [Planctomycetota bacterium]
MENDSFRDDASKSGGVEFPGLTAVEVEESRRRHGANVLTPPPRDPWWKLYLEKFEDPIIRVLLVAAVIAIGAGVVEGNYTEGIGIIIAVFLATTLGFINEYKAGQEFDLLNRVSDDEPINVIRDSLYVPVPKRDLVVGDILVLEQGEAIPADAEVLSSVSFQVSEASLTGESVPVTKRPRTGARSDEVDLAYPRHLVLRGTFVADGHALARVVSVGDASEIGKTARAAAEETETETPLNRQLAKLGQVIGVCGFGVAVLIFGVLTIRAAWQGELGERVTIGREAVSAEAGGDSPDARAVASARETLRAKYGSAADGLPVKTVIEDNERIHYLEAPLVSGQWYFFAVAVVSLMAAMARIWLPVVYDAFDVAGRELPPNAWLEKEGLAPWLQSVAAGLALFMAGVVFGMAAGWMPSSPSAWFPVSAGLELLRFFMVAVTIIVVAVPEGLPMSVTLSLAYSMRKMTAANNLVRRMHACETIGAATVICSDKTGTLTMNEMRVSAIAFSNDPGTPGGAEWRLAAEAIGANSTANLGAGENGRLTVPLGNPTECALLMWLEDAGTGYHESRNGFKVSGQLTFSTERKYMATLGAGVLPEKLTLHVKGAPEIVLSRCDSRRLPDGSAVRLEEAERGKLLAALKAEQARGMRTLGFAYRLCDAGVDGEYDAGRLQAMVEERGLVWLGFFSIADPVRPEVPDAVRACARAGVKVKMVTGDNQATAREIAAAIGMIERGADAPGMTMTGDEFMALDENEADIETGRLQIMSRAKPLAKQRLVTLLQKKGEVVAVTGDGSNDAPALNHADVGLAMGITGTSVAKEAADIILLDDSFASIVKAVMWGRSLYANIQKFILFQLTINVAALGIALLGPFLGVKLPLTVTQMLWINLIMDTFAALALASEPPDWALMDKPPRKSDAFIVTPGMGRFIFTVGGFFLALFLVLVLGFERVFPMDIATTTGRHNLSIFFSVFVFLQFWNLFNARMLGQTRSAFSRLSESRLFILIVLVIGIGQIMLTQHGGEIFRTVPLSANEWIAIILGTSPVLWIGEIVRGVKRAG